MAPSPNQPTPPSSTSSNGASPDAPPSQFRVVRKRNRVPLSCAPCRHRKLKCNRGHPCDNCTKRGDTASCSYAAPGGRRKPGAPGPNGTPDDMQNRIDRLEGLVLSLMTSGSQSEGVAAARAAIGTSRSNSLSTGSDLRLDVEGSDMIREEGQDAEEDSEVEQVSKGIGIMKMDNGRAVFASDAHWYAILGEISEVKKYFESHKEDYKEHMEKVRARKADESPGTAFLLQGPPATDRAELLAAFPSKADADRLIARYFNAYDPSVHIIHGPSFQKQYDKHWLAPHETGVVWLGMCFSMMTLALQSYHRAGDEPPEYRGRALQLSHDFRRLTAQSLLLADITQPLAQILETLILHVQAEYGRSKDAEPGVLLMVSLCVRLAMRMGYHRDPAPHPQITPFQGEIRRRVFTFVRQCDLLISFQFGLPAMIRTDHIDAQPPRNLYDDELHEDMTRLPPSRPSFEATPMSYMIAKSKMTFLFGAIVERVASITNPPSYEETMRFDAELREARASHPPLLQMRSFPESARDPANLIMQRLGLEMVYLRSLFVLHRRFIARGRENARFAPSRQTCIDASMELLAHQATLHQESQPGGRLRSVKWYISSLTTHDFLLAAMLVCLDLYHAAEAERRGRRPPNSPSSPTMPGNLYAEDQREEMLRAVEHCITIWESVREASMEAYKASMALRVMVDKLKAHQLAYQQARAQMPYSSQQQQQQQQQGSSSMDINTSSFPTPQQHQRSRAPHFGIFPNGNVADLATANADTSIADDDDNDDANLAPEHSAAMTLGMLSSGGLSPNSGGIGFGMDKQQAAYPSSMAGLLNASGGGVEAERTGLTPQGFTSSGEMGAGQGGGASPFSAMYGGWAGGATGMGGGGGGVGGGGFMGMDGLGGGEIDWSAWDNYIANNTAMDPGGSLWPMNLDLDSLGAAPSSFASAPMPQTQQAPPQSPGTNTNTGSGTSASANTPSSGAGGNNPAGVFMGASTPGMM